MNSFKDSSCKSCTRLSNNVIESNQVEQVDQEPACLTCLIPGQTGGREFAQLEACAFGFINAIGICTRTTNHMTTIWSPSGSLVIDITRLSNAITLMNSQLPTGGLVSYVESILGNIGSSVGINGGTALGITIGIILLQSLILYIIICIALIVGGTVGIAGGIVLIIIGILIVAITFAIIYTELNNFVNQTRLAVTGVGSNIITTIGCAIGAGFCCYGGQGCSCPGITGCACGNEPYGPTEFPPCGIDCSTAPTPPCGLTSPLLSETRYIEPNQNRYRNRYIT